MLGRTASAVQVNRNEVTFIARGHTPRALTFVDGILTEAVNLDGRPDGQVCWPPLTHSHHAEDGPTLIVGRKRLGHSQIH